jgi:hypothetical protein
MLEVALSYLLLSVEKYLFEPHGDGFVRRISSVGPDTCVLQWSVKQTGSGCCGHEGIASGSVNMSVITLLLYWRREPFPVTY